VNNSEENSANSFKEVEIEFHSRNDVQLSIWVEPSCQNRDIEPGFDYKSVARENCFRIEFVKEIGIILYFQYSNEYKLYKREYSGDFGKKRNGCWSMTYRTFDN